ncbi:MAG TPA: Gfo/Idh/MocA family oxidoreductase [Bacteroidia bacterium]|nr:Gfo/Idh/MocA family oxidoreductase [Bacteroidia bacterium]
MLKIVLLGAGHLGKIHLKNILQIPDFELTGFYDRDENTQKKISEEYSIQAFKNVSEAIESADIVDIVTPTISHFECAKEAITKNKSVFIEKPLANTIEEAETLVALANKHKVKVQVGHVERFNPAFVSVMEKINNPKFIETHRLAEFNPRGTDVSVILDLMIHDIDIILHTVKSPIKEIKASGVSIISDTPDIANARIAFENGCVANVTASRISMKNMRKTRFFQGDAYIAVDFLKRKSELIKISDVEGEPDPLSIILEPGPGKKSKLISFENPKFEESNAILDELKSFAHSIKNQSEPAVSIEQGYQALKVAYEIINKLNSNTVTSVN